MAAVLNFKLVRQKPEISYLSKNSSNFESFVLIKLYMLIRIGLSHAKSYVQLLVKLFSKYKIISKQNTNVSTLKRFGNKALLNFLNILEVDPVNLFLKFVPSQMVRA